MTKDSHLELEKVGTEKAQQVAGNRACRGYKSVYCKQRTEADVNSKQPEIGIGKPGEYFLGLIMAPFILLEHWRQRRQVSMQFAHVDCRTLRDAGISEAQRFIGLHKPFD